jgi:hypothetical protein
VFIVCFYLTVAELFSNKFPHSSVFLHFVNNNFYQPLCIQLTCNDVGFLGFILQFPIVDEFVYICPYNGSYLHLQSLCSCCGFNNFLSYDLKLILADACNGRLYFSGYVLIRWYFIFYFHYAH